MLKLIKAHPIAAPGFLLACVAVAFFAVQLLSGMMYWSDPEHREVTPQAWMTPRYIAHSWEMDPKDLGKALQMPKPAKERPTLSYIAKQRGITVEEVIAEVTAYLAAEEEKKKQRKPKPPAKPRKQP